jgi:hypothetical protein
MGGGAHLAAFFPLVAPHGHGFAKESRLRNWLIVTLSACLLAGCARQSRPETPEMHAYELSLAVSQSRAFAAWHGGFGGESSIYLQEVGGEGRLTDSPFRISDDGRLAYEPDAILAGNGIVVAWYEKDARTGHLSARLAQVTPQGRREWLTSFGDPRRQARNPVVRQVGDHLEAAWIEQAADDDGANAAAVWHQRFSLAGKPIGPARQIGQANRDTWNLNACASGDSLLVVYDAALSTKAHELQMLVVAAEGVRYVELSEDDGFASLYPDLQLNPAGQAALTWFDEKDGNQEVYLAAEPLATLESGRIATPLRVSHSKEDSIGAYLAWNGSTIGLAWSDVAGGRRDILVQTFTADGKPSGPLRAFPPGKGEASIPAIRARGAGFLVAWNDYLAQGGVGHGHSAASVLRVASLPVSR